MNNTRSTAIAGLACLAALVSCTGPGSSGPDSPWPSCPEYTGSLADKARQFDQLAADRHLSGDGLLRNLRLTEDLQAVEAFEHAENTILWSGIYLAAQALRYAVSGDEQAQQNARVVVDALRQLTEVTGTKGLYGRSFARPGINYDYDGSGTPWWTASPAPDYQGWWFRNDVSKDGYDGLMFGYAVALEHFDDESLLADIRQRLGEIGDHLLANGLCIVDSNGQVTEHGALFQSALDDFPGFNALLAASFIKTIAGATGESRFDDFYYGCLMRTRPGADCPDFELADLGPYIDNMEKNLFLFLPDCQQNYDNFDMAYQAIYPLLRREQDPELHRRLLGVLRDNMFHTDNPDFQSIAPLGNSFFTFVYAALSGAGPEDPLLSDAVHRAVCTLRRFPEHKYDRHIPAGTQEEVCRNRLDDPVAAEPIPLEEYHFDNYLWRLDFFEIQQERPENRRQVWSPEDYLLAYWLGRYHGIIAPDW
ncbi:MAG: hypothetical protein DRI34_06050 [Deltaproteobacteria bacterium]|nr:MAG: hypothetical protein DRI34_06050 [Deltaproteobacteria bacterium]